MSDKASVKNTRHATLSHISIFAICGLASLFASLIIYSPAVIPFLRLEAFTAFVPYFVRELLWSAVVFSFIGAVLSFIKRQISFSLLIALGGAAYLAGSVIVVFLSFSETVDDLLIFGTAIVAAFGCIALCLIWGRIFSRFNMRDALIHISLAGFLSVLIYSAIMALDPQVSTIIYLICALLSVVFAAIIGEHVPRRSAFPDDDPQKLPQTLRSLGDVLIGPIIGLMGFAFTMGSMREEFAHSYRLYLVALAVVSLILLGYAFQKRGDVVLRGLHQTFIPLSAIVLLTILSITSSLNAGGDLATFFIYLVYTFAAVITIASLCAVAHAEEFPSDLIFSVGTFLFALFSVIGQHCSEMFAEFGIYVVIAIITTLYAFAMILSAYLRRNREQNEQQSNNSQTPESLEERCRELSETHRLTARESEILLYLAQGHTGSYISEVLFISPNTARTHIHNIYRKLDISSREDVLRITRLD